MPGDKKVTTQKVSAVTHALGNMENTRYKDVAALVRKTHVGQLPPVNVNKRSLNKTLASRKTNKKSINIIKAQGTCQRKYKY